MNVALPALIIFLVLLPGFIVRTRFKLVESSSVDYSPFGRVVITAILWAGLGHTLWLTASHLVFHRTLDTAVFLRLLSSDPHQSHAIAAVADDIKWVARYFGSLFAAAYFIPPIIRILITRCRLDRDEAALSPLFRFHQAPWYYLLTGADFKKDEVPDFISVSAIVNIADEAILYTGILNEFFVDKNGTLDRLVLQQVVRRPAELNNIADRRAVQDASQYYEVDGDYFVLRYSEAITLNIEYIKLLKLSGVANEDEHSKTG